MGEDELTLTPVYRFEWSDGTVRRTDEYITEDARTPEFVEWLAEEGRADPECDVALLSMGT